MRIRTTLAATALAVAALTGCGSPAAVVATAPPAYGVTGQCYYVDDIAEAIALRAAGLCPPAWVPTLMPMTWRSQYAWYYDSPGYYNSYVPVSSRTTYVTHVHNYESSHPQAVKSAPKTAPAKVNTKPQSGQPKASFNSGSRNNGTSRPASGGGGFSGGKRK